MAYHKRMEGMSIGFGDEIWEDGRLLGFYQDLTNTDRVACKFDAIVVSVHTSQDPQFDNIFALSFSQYGAKLVPNGTNPSGFTRKLTNALSISGENFECRMYRGFHMSKEGMRDANGKLLYNSVADLKEGVLLDYGLILGERLAWLIEHFGVVSGRRPAVADRRLLASIPKERSYGYDARGLPAVQTSSRSERGGYSVVMPTRSRGSQRSRFK